MLIRTINNLASTMQSPNDKLIRQGLDGEHSDFANQYKDSLPNFIIIGAAKSATTTLTTILPKHPDIFISKPKEPKFFGRNYKKGWDWYASRFEAGKDHILRGEGSTMYTSKMKGFRHTPALMHKYLPNLKLIYIIRHPLDRIVSQWRHYRGRHPSSANFDELMSNRNLRRLVVGCSMYHQHLMAFREFYPDEQIHCMTFEDLIAAPKQSLRTTLKFLGVKPKIKRMLDKNGKLPRENEAGTKGRDHVEKPEWNAELRAEVLRKVLPDSKQMLSYMGKPENYWKL